MDKNINKVWECTETFDFCEAETVNLPDVWSVLPLILSGGGTVWNTIGRVVSAAPGHAIRHWYPAQ